MHRLIDHVPSRKAGSCSSGITPEQLFPPFARSLALDSRNRGAISGRHPCPSGAKTSALASVAYHQQAPHFRRIFIMTQVDHTRMANAIRGLAMDAVEKAKSGHPGLPMG